jgi:hypothetical protein
VDFIPLGETRNNATKIFRFLDHKRKKKAGGGRRLQSHEEDGF